MTEAHHQVTQQVAAMHPNRPLNRELLATLLWPEESQKTASTNFRQTLYQLRKRLPADTLQVTRQTVEFVGGENFSCDVHQFERAIEQGELSTAASLFTGELAAGLTTDSLGFEAWLRQEREHLHQKALNILEQLTIKQLDSGDFTAAIETARQQLSLEPWLESAHRQLMRALALSGDRNGALAQFEQCKQILDEELGVEPQQQIINYFSNKRALLLLDNFEHLLAAGAAKAVSAFLQGAPDLQILVTSRQKLNLTGETIFNIEGLAFPDWESTADALSYSAVQLFVQSAKRAMIDFELDEESLPHVAEICRLTEGMPLGILLAAAWVDMLSLSEIADEIQADADFLAGERGDLPPRQRSMRAVFEYSWAMLSEPEQNTLAQLSAFRGGATRKAVQAITGASLRQLSGLLNKSLIQRNTSTGRFALHELLRQLAAEKLQSAPINKANEIHTKHAGYFLNWIGGLYDALGNDDAAHTLQRIRPDHQNVLSGWLWAAQHHQRDDLLSAMDTWHYYMQGSDRNQETIDTYNQTLKLLPENDPSFTDLESKNSLLRARLLIRLAEKSVLVDHQAKPTDLEVLYRYSQQRGEHLEEGILSLPLGLRAINQHNFPKAKTLLFNAIHILEEVQDNLRLMIYLHNVGSIMLLANQTELAVSMLERQIALAQKSNNKIFEATATNWLTSEALLGQNNCKLALERAETAVRLGMDLWSQGFTVEAVMVGLSYAGYYSVLNGDLPRAETFLHKAQEIANTRNTQRHHYMVNMMRWFIQVTRGDYDDVPMQHVEVDWSGAEALSRKVFGFTAAALGNHKIALSILVWVWTKPLIWSWTLIIVLYMPIALALLVDDGRYRYAAELLAMCRTHPGCPHSWWAQLALLKDIETRIEANLSPEELAAAQAHGRELDLKTTTAALIEELKTMAAELESQQT